MEVTKQTSNCVALLLLLTPGASYALFVLQALTTQKSWQQWLRWLETPKHLPNMLTTPR